MMFITAFAAANLACNTTDFKPANGQQCNGLHDTPATDADSCAQACCADTKCTVWQWCADNTICHGGQGGGCWTGSCNSFNKKEGWVGGIRAGPSPPKGPFTLNKAKMDKSWDGLGGLSGGGATTRLLVDYKEPQRSEILDYLFKPNFGASLQILKVEIGGDSQSTDGTESSHMHDAKTVDLKTGYEWWLMTEAKKRNPNIKLYGLPWAYPGWVGNDPVTGKPSGSPFTFPNQTSHYIMEWIKGAKTEYNLDIDYIGIWNERASDATYAESLRNTLNEAGFGKTKIVAKDGGADICDSMHADPKYAATVDIIGLHYPSDFNDYSKCHNLNKPVWASEESSSYDDLNGAACWARVINSHYVLSGITSSIMWNLVGAYYHGTNWYASSMLTSVQPWSGHYDTLPVVWASAHITQFTEIGWRYLANGAGSGELPGGGYFTTIVDPSGSDFTLQVVKISHDHAPCTRPSLPPFDVNNETVTFILDPSLGFQGDTLALWRSNFEQETTLLFEKQEDVKVANGQFTLDVAIGDYFTVSTVRTAQKGTTGTTVPDSQPSFPLPHSDTFDGVVESQEAKWFADQIGAFEAHPETGNASNTVMRQMVPQLPIGWSDHGSNGPMTLIGMREWQDLTVSVDFKLPAAGAAACVGSRVEQMWKQGLVVCVSAQGQWNLTIGGPPQNGVYTKKPIASGKAAAPGVGSWHTLSLTTVDTAATASLDGKALFTKTAVRNIDTGFAAIGMNEWYAVEFDNFHIEQAAGTADRWTPTGLVPATCANHDQTKLPAGTKLSVRDCQPNGVAAADQSFELLPDWQLRHIPSGLCAAAARATAGAAVTLEACDFYSELQKFKNDYTRIRNKVDPMNLVADSSLLLAGTNGGGAVTVEKSGAAGMFHAWSAFPNTNQLRDAYTAGDSSAYPLCLSTCPA
jgi:galactosylceramidase